MDKIIKKIFSNSHIILILIIILSLIIDKIYIKYFLFSEMGSRLSPSEFI